MTLEREVGCSATRWRFDVTPACAELLADSHAQFDAVELPRLGATRSFSIGRHKLIVVTTTGRGQVRLNMATPPEARLAAAHAIWRAMVQAVPLLDSEPPGPST